jgi:hypothetical protein
MQRNVELARSHVGSRFVAIVFIALGLIFNQWTVEMFLVDDGQIKSVRTSVLLVVMQLAMIGWGIAVWRKHTDWLINLSVAALSLLVVLVLLEVSVRILGIEAEHVEPRRDAVFPAPGGPRERLLHAFIPGATIRSTYSSNPRGYFDPGNVVDHVHNSAGWRDSEHEIEKPSGSFRILGLGDSYLFGQGVRRDDIALKRLDSMLEGYVGDRRVETISTGMSGTNTSYQFELLRDRGLRYDPDLVIQFFVLNDVEQYDAVELPHIEFFTNYTSLYQRADKLALHSHLWGWVRQRYCIAFTTRNYIRESVAAFSADSPGWKKSRIALDEIHGLLRERGIPFLVVIFPFFHELDGDYPFQKIHQIVVAHCVSAQIPVLDLRESYRAYNGPELWVHESDQHPNELANRIAAQSIVTYLKSHRSLLSGGGESGEEPRPRDE